MAVDIKLNNMIDALGRLERVRIEDVELSVRAHNALKRLGAVTLADAQRAIIDRDFIKQPNVGRRTVDEVREIIANVAALPEEALPQPDNVLRTEPECLLRLFKTHFEALQTDLRRAGIDVDITFNEED